MRKRKWVIVISSILFMEGIALLGLSAIGKEKLSAENKTPNQATTSELGADKQKRIKNEKRVAGEKVREIYKRNKKALILVNADTPLSEAYETDLRTICSGRLQASKKLYSSLTEMLADAGQKGFHYWIASAWRSRDKQQRLIDEDVQKLMRAGNSYEESLNQTYMETMPAGHSEHETGLALDILVSGNTDMDISQEKESGNVWLRKHCHHYGFILRYPKDKEDITGISYEPWHFRYVGREAAAYMKKHHLTLEEFWEKL